MKNVDKVPSRLPFQWKKQNKPSSKVPFGGENMIKHPLGCLSSGENMIKGLLRFPFGGENMITHPLHSLFNGENMIKCLLGSISNEKTWESDFLCAGAPLFSFFLILAGYSPNEREWHILKAKKTFNPSSVDFQGWRTWTHKSLHKHTARAHKVDIIPHYTSKQKTHMLSFTLTNKTSVNSRAKAAVCTCRQCIRSALECSPTGLVIIG